MYLIRDVFRCKPGKASALAGVFKKVIPLMEKDSGFSSCRVMVDYVASYWTVVLQTEVEKIEQYTSHMDEHRVNPEMQKAMEGYMEFVEEGHREIYRII